MTDSTKSNLIQKEFNLEHHCGYRVAGQFIFTCQIERHNYFCEQPFDYCPSCAMNIKLVKVVTNDSSDKGKRDE